MPIGHESLLAKEGLADILKEEELEYKIVTYVTKHGIRDHDKKTVTIAPAEKELTKALTLW